MPSIKAVGLAKPTKITSLVADISNIEEGQLCHIDGNDLRVKMNGEMVSTTDTTISQESILEVGWMTNERDTTKLYRILPYEGDANIAPKIGFSWDANFTDTNGIPDANGITHICKTYHDTKNPIVTRGSFPFKKVDAATIAGNPKSKITLGHPFRLSCDTWTARYRFSITVYVLSKKDVTLGSDVTPNDIKLMVTLTHYAAWINSSYHRSSDGEMLLAIPKDGVAGGSFGASIFPIDGMASTAQLQLLDHDDIFSAHIGLIAESIIPNDECYLVGIVGRFETQQFDAGV